MSTSSIVSCFLAVFLATINIFYTTIYAVEHKTAWFSILGLLLSLAWITIVVSKSKAVINE